MHALACHEHRATRASSRRRQNLSRLFAGVHGRIFDICKPALKKYHAATAIAMGKSMDAIVVDEEKVALDCIKYLKEKKCPPETFVPLDSIRTKPARTGNLGALRSARPPIPHTALPLLPPRTLA